jgi:signal transduction histidine kinase
MSSIILLCGMASIGWWISSQIEGSVLNRAAFTTALYVDSFVSQPLQGLATDTSLTPAAVAEIERLLTGTALGHEVIAFKVWGPGGRVVYSPDSVLLNQVFPVGEELQTAWEGRVAADVSNLESVENIRERPQADRLLEIYSPVRAHGSGQVIAVVEFYQRVDELESLIGAARLRSWLIVLAVTLAMYLLLGGYVHSSSATITRQKSALRAQVARLEDLLAQNAELNERVRRAAARSTAYNERVLRRISADLHDGPAQYLGLAILRLDRVTAACEQLPSPGQAISDIEHIHSSLNQAMQEVRSISAGLGLPQLDQLTISEVVERAVRVHERRTGTKVQLHSADLPAHPWGLATKMTVYRVVQEGLSNAFRHAKGVGQRVELRVVAGCLHLVVADKGPASRRHPLANGASTWASPVCVSVSRVLGASSRLSASLGGAREFWPRSPSR